VRYHVEGRRFEEGTGTGDRRQAEAYLARLRRELRDGTWRPPAERDTPAVLTVAAYLGAWLERRQAAGVVKADDEARYFKVHVLPEIGAMPLADVKRAHVRELVEKIRRHTSAATGKRLAPRTELHVYRTLATAFSDAVLDEVLPATPCTLRTRRGELPTKRDADPQWRAEAVYTRAEIEQLLSDERVPLDRRVYYALAGLGGLRSSEVAGIPWRAYDAAAQPLGRLTVASQADDGETSRGTKTGETREVPVVPALAALLAEWRLSGFPKLFGWHPRPDDPIVPSRISKPGAMRFRSKKMLESIGEDLARLGLRAVPSPRHALRATFLSLLEVDGANMGIARRATHAAPSDVVGGYIRVQWSDVCREVGKLRVELRRGAQVIAMPIARMASGTGAGFPEVHLAITNHAVSRDAGKGASGADSHDPLVFAGDPRLRVPSTPPEKPLIRQGFRRFGGRPPSCSPERRRRCRVCAWPGRSSPVPLGACGVYSAP
jgi:hypothetical protein